MKVVLKRMAKGGSVAGTITDSKGKPIAGARVANYSNSSEPNCVTKTDAKGRYRLDDTQAGYAGLSIAIKAKGFAPQMVHFDERTAEHAATANATLELGHSVHGRVVDENGKPIAGVIFTACSSAYPMGKITAGAMIRATAMVTSRSIRSPPMPFLTSRRPMTFISMPTSSSSTVPNPWY